MTARPRPTPRDDRAELSAHIEAWTTFILSNIVWFIVSIPLVTMPAATVGLFAYLSARARGRQPDFFRTYFGAVRQHWRKATILGVIDVVIGGLVILNLSIFPRMDMTADLFAFVARSMTIFVAAAALMLNLYVWSLMVLLEDASLKKLVENAAALFFTHPLWSLGVLIASALPTLISLLLPQGIFALATISLTVLIATMGTWRVIRQHLDADLLQKLTAPRQP